MNSVHATVEILGQQARQASRKLALLESREKDRLLSSMANAVRAGAPRILRANLDDLVAAIERHLPAAMLDRLRLDERRIEGMALAVERIAGLPDPVGTTVDAWARSDGMLIEQVRVPIGTIGIVYESRPNVTLDAAALCLKSGNAVILRGGSEALRTNTAIAEIIASCGVPEHAIQLVPCAEREAVVALARMDAWVDLLIPRGGRGLIETVVSAARVPVIKHYDGVCHVFVDQSADLKMALRLVLDSKLDNCSACNALETLVVHSAIAEELLPGLADALRAERVELRGCGATRAIVPDCCIASDDDWRAEYLDRVLAIRVVDSLDAAIEHINSFGSHHTDAIVTENAVAAGRFLREVDSACVFHNVSTRLADGGEFGFGAEIGISTDKIHARGPMGLRELTSYQYRVRGTGQTRGATI
jgi:glutamate-5-semialdehyde dehydrogenase